MPQALIFRCPGCGTGLKEPDAENATWVVSGAAVCGARCWAKFARPVLPAEQLSLTFFEPSQPVLALHGPP